MNTTFTITITIKARRAMDRVNPGGVEEPELACPVNRAARELVQHLNLNSKKRKKVCFVVTADVKRLRT